MTATLPHLTWEVRPPGTDVVIRALPGSPDVPWSTLLSDISGVVDKVVRA